MAAGIEEWPLAVFLPHLGGFRDRRRFMTLKPAALKLVMERGNSITSHLRGADPAEAKAPEGSDRGRELPLQGHRRK